MADTSGALPVEVEDVLDRFFDDRATGLTLLGRDDASPPLGLEAQGAEDPNAPLLSRLLTFERHLLNHLDLAARQHDEIASYGEDYAEQLRGEVISTLIALRELWRCVPELVSNAEA